MRIEIPTSPKAIAHLVALRQRYDDAVAMVVLAGGYDTGQVVSVDAVRNVVVLMLPDAADG